MHSPFGGWCHHLPAPLGSVSLDSQSPTAPCESSSLATLAVRLVNQKEGPFMGRLRAYFDQLAHPMQDVHSGTITRAYCRAIYEERPRGVLFFPLNRGKSGAAGKGEASAASQSAELFFMPYDTESKSRNADFISIARRAIRNPRPEGPSNLRTLRPSGRSILRTLSHNPFPQPFYTTRRRQAVTTLGAKPCQPSHRRCVPKTLFERKQYYAV